MSKNHKTVVAIHEIHAQNNETYIEPLNYGEYNETGVAHKYKQKITIKLHELLLVPCLLISLSTDFRMFISTDHSSFLLIPLSPRHAMSIIINIHFPMSGLVIVLNQFM